jgi:hypothetical protein
VRTCWVLGRCILLVERVDMSSGNRVGRGERRAMLCCATCSVMRPQLRARRWFGHVESTRRSCDDLAGPSFRCRKDGPKRQPSPSSSVARKVRLLPSAGAYSRHTLNIFSHHSRRMRPPATTTLSAARWSIRLTTGRAAAYRRISTAPTALPSSAPPRSLPSIYSQSQPSPLPFLRSNFLPQDVRFQTSSVYARQFSSGSALHEQAQKQKVVKEDAPEPQSTTKQSTTEGSTAQKAAGEQAKEGEETKEKKAGEEETGEKKAGEEGEKKEKKDAPPPPPHGDKTPWQVFTDTLKTEFQASKEWNEGTKELSGSIHDFTQNPQVQKAKQLSDEAKTKTAEALKATGRAVGQGAAWTWDTMPVKGVRAAARVTGTGLEYATRPVRQTKAFQAISETIDDGSSSRYGGWTEKEERRRRRELRELNELERTGGKSTGPMVEDLEYGHTSESSYSHANNQQSRHQRHPAQRRQVQGSLAGMERQFQARPRLLQHEVRLQ